MHNRKQDRIDLYLRFPVYLADESVPLGYMQNLSTGGVMVVSERDVALNQTLHLRMALPSEFEGIEEIRFLAHAVWREADANPKLATIGFKFDEVGFADYQIIHSLLPRYSVQDRSGGDEMRL